MQDAARKLLPTWRVASCCRAVIAHEVKVIHSPAHQTASFGGLMVCGSVWTCPVCAARIGAKRTDEIRRAAASWQARGGQLFMLTLTLRHNKARRLDELINRLNQAYRSMRQGKQWVGFCKEYGVRGAISAREVTHGRNGWHPHLHILLFVRTPLSYAKREDMRDFFFRRWFAALQRLGEDCTEEHGADLVQADESVDRYFTKLSGTWDYAIEISGINSKKGKQGGKTPAQLLSAYARGNASAGRRYKEYADATKGKNWIVWSPGLKKELLGEEEEQTDQQLAEQPEQGGQVLAVLTRPQWRHIQTDGLRGPLLEVAREGDAGQLAIWLAEQGLILEAWQLGQGAGGARGSPG